MSSKKLKDKSVAIIGTGIAGLSASWLLSREYNITVYEKNNRIGGHSNTCYVDKTAVDTGFIVYNEKNYPNLISLFNYLGVKSCNTDMSFAASLDSFEYSGKDFWSLIAEKKNLFRPRFWIMLKDIIRFYKQASSMIKEGNIEDITLGNFLSKYRYSNSFQIYHLLPLASSIWSAPIENMLNFPLKSFIYFSNNHGLLQLKNRPQWRTVIGGSQQYVKKLISSFEDRIYIGRGVHSVWTANGFVYVKDNFNNIDKFDKVIIASHANETLKMLKNPTLPEKNLLDKFAYQSNKVVLHKDVTLMPKNKNCWSSWNYTADRKVLNKFCVTYWMNRLQNLDSHTNYFVTLNPMIMPRKDSIIKVFSYDHPIFDKNAILAQRLIWNIQGKRNIWFCGSYFGYGFHEDALQSGLKVAESIGKIKRPWCLENESSRINLPIGWPKILEKEVA